MSHIACPISLILRVSAQQFARSLTLVVRVPAVLLVGILDECDVGQGNLAHVLHQVEPPTLSPAK